MKYEVHQLDIPSWVYDEVNAIGHEATCNKYPIWKYKLDSSFRDFAEDGLTVDEACFYKKVCEIDANSLDDVFHIGNMGPEEKIKRLNKMHSVSVGDIIVNKETKESHIVAGFGFTKITFV
jgi:hypothetical protein